MTQVSLKRIPNFLKARSPKGLRRLMLLNNAKYSTFFEYKDIAPVLESCKLYWYAWFYKVVDTNDIKDLEAPPTEDGDING